MESLTYKNALNVIAVILNVLSRIDYGPANNNMEWLNSVREFGRFETIVTPVDSIFFITQIIVLFQVVFAVVQLLPRYSMHELVQEGVSYWFFVATIVQFASSICFSLETFIGFCLSTILIALEVCIFLKILFNQSSGSIHVTNHSAEDYWLLRFPFSLQAGWFISIFIVSLNNFFAWLGFSASMQVVLAVISLLTFAGTAAKMLVFNGGRPNYVIPGVFAVFTFGIASDFQTAGIEDDFGVGVVVFLMALTSVVSIGIACATGYYLYYNEYKSQTGNANGDEDGDGDGDYEGAEMVSPTEVNAAVPEGGGTAMV